eukprot:gene8257-9139_t
MSDAMEQTKMSVSMKGAMVLNKNKSDELNRKVKHYRKSRDEILMELKAEKLRLALHKVQEERNSEPSDKTDDNRNGNAYLLQRRFSRSSNADVEIKGNRFDQFSLPPILNRRLSATNTLLQSLSEPTSPVYSPLLRRKGFRSEKKDEERKEIIQHGDHPTSLARLSRSSSCSLDLYNRNIAVDSSNRHKDRPLAAVVGEHTTITRLEKCHKNQSQRDEKKCQSSLENSRRHSEGSRNEEHECATDDLGDMFGMLKNCRYLRR